VNTHAYDVEQDRLVREGRLTRFKVTMEFEVEVRGGKVAPIPVMREAGELAHEVASKLVKVLRRATGRKSVGIGQSGTGPSKSMYAYEGEEPFLPVTDKSLKYKVRKP
jgi:hypothetical protein